MCALRIFAWRLYTIYWVTSCLRLLPFYTNLQPEYVLPSWTRFGQFQNERNQLGAPSSPATPKDKFLHAVLSFVLFVGFDLPSSINF